MWMVCMWVSVCVKTEDWWMRRWLGVCGGSPSSLRWESSGQHRESLLSRVPRQLRSLRSLRLEDICHTRRESMFSAKTKVSKIFVWNAAFLSYYVLWFLCIWVIIIDCIKPCLRRCCLTSYAILLVFCSFTALPFYISQLFLSFLFFFTAVPTF